MALGVRKKASESIPNFKGKGMSKTKNWREIYIKILSEGPSEDEYIYAAELVDEGYAKAAIIKNNTGMGNPIAKLHWKGPTTAGREYLDDLKERVKRQSLGFRIWSGIVLVITWLFGFMSQVLVQWIGNP